MDPRVLVPILIPLGALALTFGIFYLKNKENMALIERGINPRQNAPQPKPFINLKYGLLFIGAGIGLLCAYLLDRYVDLNMSNEKFDHENPAIYFALIAIGGGIGLVQSYRIEKKEWLDKRKEQE